MRKIKNLLLICFVSLIPMSVCAEKKSETYDWSKVMNAIIQVESGGNEKAYNKDGDCVGVLQITPILVRECNDILKKQKSNKRYTLNDRWNAKKSKEMFVLLQNHFNKEHNVEKAIKCWNSTFYAKDYKSRSKEYYKKVMRYYNGGK